MSFHPSLPARRPPTARGVGGGELGKVGLGLPRSGRGNAGGMPSGGDVPRSPWPPKGCRIGPGTSLPPSSESDPGSEVRPLQNRLEIGSRRQRPEGSAAVAGQAAGAERRPLPSPGSSSAKAVETGQVLNNTFGRPRGLRAVSRRACPSIRHSLREGHQPRGGWEGNWAEGLASACPVGSWQCRRHALRRRRSAVPVASQRVSYRTWNVSTAFVRERSWLRGSPAPGSP